MAGRHITNLKQFLFSLQTTFGTEETPLDATDLAEVLSGFVAAPQIQVAPVQLVGAGFSQNASVIGATPADVTCVFPLRTGGTADATGPWTKFLQCGGMVESELSDVYTYTPSNLQSLWKDGTVNAFSGSRDTTEAFLRIIYNCMFNAKFMFDFTGEEAFGKVEFTGKGIYKAAPALGTQVTITKSPTAIPPLKGCTINFFGNTDYDILKFEVDLGNEVVITKDPSSSTGLGIALLSNRLAKWSATVYKDGDTAPETTFMAGTPGTISFSVGSAPNKYTIASGANKAQITEYKDGDQEGIETDEMSGIFIDNDFTVAVDTTV